MDKLPCVIYDSCLLDYEMWGKLKPESEGRGYFMILYMEIVIYFYLFSFIYKALQLKG